MITTALLTLGLFCSDATNDAASPGLTTPAVAHAAADSAYRSLYESGQTFADFVAHATARKAQWEGNHALNVAPDALVTRAVAAGQGWKLLVVAVSSCSDSVNSIPYLASLLGRVPGVEMRIVDMTAGRWVMEAHRTPDGRAATPTVVLLDGEFNERGCWIERPAELIRRMSSGESFEGKMQWYDRDRGASSLAEIVEMIETAAAGGKKC